MLSGRFSKWAQRDLEAIRQHIAADNPLAAEQVRKAILDTADLLATNRDIGALIRNATARYSDVRWFVVSRFRNYLIFYRPYQETIVVLRILHASQDWTRHFGTK